jgi:HAD superfamily hydrolase (TIGR01509 family)
LKLIIFDFDGVVADSERLANAVLAEGLTEVGLFTTVEEAMERYMGRRWADCLPEMEARLGARLPDGFALAQIKRAHARIVSDVQPVSGLKEFLAEVSDVPRCIASSSTLDYIGQCLDRMLLAEWFEHRFSGHEVPRGKPHPDLFLKAASTLGAAPAECVVIEDSPAGVKAGKAAGMFTIGLCAGGHVGHGHASRLKEAGADEVAASYAEVAQALQIPTAANL